MDKFGIFNILGNLLSSMPQKNSDDSDGKNSLFDTFKNKILDFLPDKTQNLKEKQTAPDKEVKQNIKPPLQSNMINIMNSHDKFVERVYKNNLKK